MGRREQAAEHAESGRFSCAIGTEQAEHLATANLETDMVHGREGAKLADQIIHLDDHLLATGLLAHAPVPLRRAGPVRRALGARGA